MRHLKTAFRYMHRSPYQTVSVFMVMALTFFISAVFLLVAFSSQIILNWFETKPQVTAFIKEGVKMEQVKTLEDKLQQTGKIKETKYIYKEDALNVYKDWTQGEPLLQEMVTANLLPASLEISTNNVNMLKDIADILTNDPIIDEVIFPQDVVSSLVSFTSALRKIGVVLILFISLVSVFEILMIIGMKITMKKEEIEILRLIGASSWYVRLPFIYEGIIYGVGGAFIGWLFSYILLLYSTPFFVSYLAEIPLFPIYPLVMLVILGAMTATGLIIGAIGSFLAVRRYLR